MHRHLALILTCLLLVDAAYSETVYDYRVVEKRPNNRENFVQGLEINKGQLYISTGGFGTSGLQRYNFENSGHTQFVPLHQSLFGEGVTVLKDRVYQLTWRSGRGAIYDRASLKQIAWFTIPGQGWGLCNNGQQLIYSDGSDKLTLLSPTTLRKVSEIAVHDQGNPVQRLNELEWIDNRIWANVWQTERLVIIDPVSGEVTASVDLSGLLPEHERQADTDVLNGIAYDHRKQAIWVTGKRWPWLYQIELVPQ